MAYKGPHTRVTGVYCREHRSPVGYPLLSTSSQYTVRDVNVEARLTQVYQAATNTEREVYYLFEIPPEAAVTQFSAQVGSIVVNAVIKEKGEADKLYKAAVAANQSAWKLDQLNTEVFQISLGSVKPNDTITIRLTFIHIISSDTLEDTIRLTIPATLGASRAGAAPVSETTAAKAIAGSNAVDISIGIEMQTRVLRVASPSHQINTFYGFSDASVKDLSPAQQDDLFDATKAFISYTSKDFLDKNFVLTWAARGIDSPRCLIEQLGNPAPGEQPTLAFTLTQVSPLNLPEASHEFIFLVDFSGSMSGRRIEVAKEAVNLMLDQLPSVQTTFNIYTFTTNSASVLPGGKSRPYDAETVKDAKTRIRGSPSGGTNINQAINTVLAQRNTQVARSTIVVVTDGFDWGITSAIDTISKAVDAAALKQTLLRVFVLGIGDQVSRGMCESLARAGMGATSYITESLYDDVKGKAETLILSIGRAPVRVRSVKWPVEPPPASTSTSGNVIVTGGGRAPIQTRPAGPPVKGNNLAPPPDTQQAPGPGTMFWAIRSSWFAICKGSLGGSTVTVEFDIPGDPTVHRQTIRVTRGRPGNLLHKLAARALIQTFEDKTSSLSENARYNNEAEIIRLGVKYGLASSQTSFVATINGVGTQTVILRDSNAAAFEGVNFRSQSAGLDFVTVQEPSSAARMSPMSAPDVSSFSTRSMPMAMSSFTTASFEVSSYPPHPPPPTTGLPASDFDVDSLKGIQTLEGSFPPRALEPILFSSSGIPRMADSISALSGTDSQKEELWATILVTTFLTKQTANSEDDSGLAAVCQKALDFVRMTLDCVFGLSVEHAENVVANSLKEAYALF